ncbi:MAG: hypothetical protein CO187_09065 [Zetaproteobacteria bacterium CG_4_9_14_3_um_filter_53_7]|nr:MAG: hypothetical protein CO187_09065 [Zetaproteobacteria bacterium CG_4_9_14_3_um_filter_53_7]
MGLIIFTSLICAAGILFGTEFFKFLKENPQPDEHGYQPGKLAAFCLRHRGGAIVATAVWITCWLMISAFLVYELLTNSKAYFTS